MTCMSYVNVACATVQPVIHFWWMLTMSERIGHGVSVGNQPSVLASTRHHPDASAACLRSRKLNGRSDN